MAKPCDHDYRITADISNFSHKGNRRTVTYTCNKCGDSYTVEK